MHRSAWSVIACTVVAIGATALAISGIRTQAGVVEAASSPGDVVINEVAWMGTQASTYDEWIELHNNAESDLDLTGWSLVALDGTPHITLSGTIPAHGYFLLERTDDQSVSDIPADQTYTGALRNSPEAETLTLYDAEGRVVDTANLEGGPWPAGDNQSKSTMERVDPTAPDAASNWCTNDGATRNGLDADGNPINGTPKAANSCYQPSSPRTANLHVAKSGTAIVRPGDPITFWITLGNTGVLTAWNTVLTDSLPSVVISPTQTSPFTASLQDGVVVWQIGDLPAAATYRITMTAHVRAMGPLPETLVNLVTASTTAPESTPDDNVAVFTSTVRSGHVAFLPLLFQNYTPPPYGLIIEALLYDGLQIDDKDEAVLLTNGYQEPIDLGGWELCKRVGMTWTCADLPAVSIGPQDRLWLARDGFYFARSFGFAVDPAQVLSTWPRMNNGGGEVALRDPDGVLRDVLVYKGGLTDTEGWDGPAVQPYREAGFAEEGQILYRWLAEESGLPGQDTDTAADWAQWAGDAWRGRRVRYPGWDLERFFQPAVDGGGTVMVGVAPDNAFDLVVDTVRSARERIDIEAYTLEHHGLVAELVERARAGVTVTVLLEHGPVGGIADQELWACGRLHATGRGTCHFMVQRDQPKTVARYRYLHAKMIIVDRARLLLGSQNLVHTSLPGDDKANGTGGSRGVVVVTDAPHVVARAVEIFQADCDPDHHVDIEVWTPETGSPPPDFVLDRGADWVTYTVRFPHSLTATGADFELITAPESALRTSDALLGLVARAGAGDEICAEQLYERRDWGDPVRAPNLRLQAYLDAARRGARVRILLNGGSFDLAYLPLTENTEAAAWVNEVARAEGLNLSAHLGDPTQYGIHNKMVLVDLRGEGQYVHVGSINGSETSSKINREVALQVRSRDLFNYLYDVFEYDWDHQPPRGHVLISEVMYDPAGVDAGREWVEIYNPTTANVDISGWYLGDVGPQGEYGSGLYRFPAGATLVAEGVVVVAHQAQDVAFPPDYEFLIDRHRDDPAVPNMVPAGSWDGFGLALGNGGDEVLLLDANQVPVDVVTYGDGRYGGIVPHPGVSAPGHSLERRPPRQDTDDCSVDFFDRYPPTPGTLPE